MAAEGRGGGDRVPDVSADVARQLIRSLPIPMGIHEGGRILLTNDAFASMLGASGPEGLEGLAVGSLVPEGDAAWVAEHLRGVYAGELTEPVTVQLLGLDGRTVPVEVTSIPIRFDGRPAALLDCRDVTGRVEAEDALRASEARWRALVQHGNDLIVILDREARVSYVSPSVSTILGRDPIDLVGAGIVDLIHPEDVGLALKAVAARIADPDRPHEGFRVRARAGDGGWRWLDTFSTNLLHDPDVEGVIINAWDVTHQVEAERRLLHLARHDSLTGLPNRVLLAERLDRALSDGRVQGTLTGLLMLDLDRFKDVNDTLGHEAGDRVLAELAARLAEAVRADDVVGRIGGDEFAVVLPDAVDAATVEAVARRILSACSEPVVDGGMQLRVGASIGMVLAPEHGDEASILLRRADVAMYRAKDTRVGVVAATEGDLDDGRRRLQAAGELRSAMERGELSCVYQPKCSLVDGRAVGMEALLRWDHPSRGVVGPDEFVADAEHLGLMNPLTEVVLEHALGWLVRWTDAHLGLTVAVNVSATVLHDPRFAAMVEDVLERTGADPVYLVLEVTEQAAMVQPGVSLTAMEALRAIGIAFSIDDFGTGQSSLTYLRRLPVQEVKIDRSFIIGLVDGTPDAAIARSVVDLAHNLGMAAVAEGIETEAELALVRGYQCDLGQGWHLGRPMPGDEVEGWCRTNTGW